MTFSELIQNKTGGPRGKAVLTLTPCWEELPAPVKQAYKSVGAGLFAFNKALLDGVAEKAAGVLLNTTAFFSYGLSGAVCLKSTIDYAKTLGLIVMADTDMPGSCRQIRTAVRAWTTAADASLPEDSPLREGAFDCDAMSFTAPFEEETLRQLAAETERCGAGLLFKDPRAAFSQAADAAESVGKETAGLLLSGTCREITDAADRLESFLLLAAPTGFQKPEELKALAGRAALLIAPKEVRSPKAFAKFTEMIGE